MTINFNGAVAEYQIVLNSQISVNLSKKNLTNITTLLKFFLNKFTRNLKIYAKPGIRRQPLNELSEFQKEFKRFGKKYKSLSDDLQEFCNVVSVVPLGNSKHFNIITQTEFFYIVKARLFCRYLKGSSLRIVYSYFEKKQYIEFIELYFKGDKENEDRRRIKEYLKNNQS